LRLLAAGNGHIRNYGNESRRLSDQLIFARINALQNEISMRIAHRLLNDGPGGIRQFKLHPSYGTAVGIENSSRHAPSIRGSNQIRAEKNQPEPQPREVLPEA